MTTNHLYSIGYATKPIEIFIAQLHKHKIDAVADVRSVPYSKAFYDYHRETLAATLKREGIYYVYLGEELGPRSKDKTHYDEHHQVQFDRLMQSPLYLQGIERLQEGMAKGMGIALMCAEKDPLDCHRSLLVGYYLQAQLGLGVQHIDHHGDIESQSDLEDRLMAIHGVAADMFSSSEEQKALAWRAQCRLKAYRRPSEME